LKKSLKQVQRFANNYHQEAVDLSSQIASLQEQQELLMRDKEQHVCKNETSFWRQKIPVMKHFSAENSKHIHRYSSLFFIN